MRIQPLRRMAKQMMNLCLMGSIFFAPCTVAYPTRLAAAAKPVAQKPSKIVAAYVYDAKNPTLLARDAATLTHINWSFALIEDGRVTGDHWRNIDKLLAYKKKHPRIKTVVSIGGWEADGFSQAASSPEGIQAFVDSTLELMVRYDFDGVDIDWEYPGSSAAGIASAPEDKQNFTKLLKALRGGLDTLARQDGRYRTLSIAVGASNDCVRGIECAKIAPLLDYVYVMTYDMHGGQRKTAHHTNLYPAANDPGGMSADTILRAFERAGIPRNKLVIGAAFYGHLWKGVTEPGERGDGFAQAATTSGGSAVSFANIVKSYLNQGDYVRHWDEAARAPYLYNGERFISYDDEQSVYEKAAYVRTHGLAGVMFWEYTHDPSGALLNAIDKGLHP